MSCSGSMTPAAGSEGRTNGENCSETPKLKLLLLQSQCVFV